MQKMEIVVVNFGDDAPIYTEAVFPDPEVRSIVEEREEQDRQRRREARRRARNNERRNNERRTAVTSATTASTSTTTSSDRTSNRNTTNRPSASSRPNRPTTLSSASASTSGQQSQTPARDSDSDSDSGNETQDSPVRQTGSSMENSEEEWIVCSLPRNNNEEVQISVHSEHHQQQQQRRALPPTRQLLTVPPTNQRRTTGRRFRWFSRSAPMANQNRHHPDEDVEEWWLSPEPSPHQSPIHSPVVQRIARKWKNKSALLLNGCNTCRGDVAIHSHQRPRLTQGFFKKVVPGAQL